MHRRTIIASFAALFAGALILAVTSAAVAGGTSPKVTVRIEGISHTLLKTTTVSPASGFITKGGAPKGDCPSASAAGALSLATKGDWSGSFSTKYKDYFVTSILGESHATKTSYWSILVNNVPASTGVCGIKLKAGEQILFAAIPTSSTGLPLVIKAPASASSGTPFTVTVVADLPKGGTKTEGGVSITGAGKTVKTNAKGVAKIGVSKAGTLSLNASKTGYIRAATASVNVLHGTYSGRAS